MKKIKLIQRAALTLAVSAIFAGCNLAAQQPVPVPHVNANLGSCTVEFTVSKGENQPLYNAEISVKIAYGFMGMKKMDLKVGTNSEGKARFVGLPEKVHHPPLNFIVRAEGLTKTVDYYPTAKCQARYSVIMNGR